MRVAVVTGECAKGACGVGDYSRCLADSLNSLGAEVAVVAEGRWGVRDVPAEMSGLRRINPDIIHIQYPTSGFGHRLGPQLFALMRSSVVTIHEASQAHVLRKLSLYPFTIRASHLIFTSEYERQFAAHWAPWIRQVSSVIPLGSNIQPGPPGQKGYSEVVYFGLLMPNKGLEEVFRLAALIKAEGLKLTVRLIGSYRPEHKDYVERMRRESADLPMMWEEGLTHAEVSVRLASSSIAYLPYPDGASERRASLQAALVNGVAVITTRGRATPSELEPVVKFAASPAQALDIVRGLQSDVTERARLASRAISYMQKFSWDRIGQSHLDLYRELIVSNGSRH